MPDYWQKPPKWHLVAWAARRWPEDAAKFRRMRFGQLRAIWHETNRADIAAGELARRTARAHEDAILEPRSAPPC